MHDSQPGSDSLVLDIGGTIGALVIHADSDLVDAEIEISPGVDPEAHRVHNVVHIRRSGNRIGHSAVFPAVPEGTYTVWANRNTSHGTVAVRGGHVSEYQFTSPSAT